MKKEISVQVTEANDRYVIVEARIIAEETVSVETGKYSYIAAANVCSGDIAQAVDEAVQKALAGARKLSEYDDEIRQENCMDPEPAGEDEELFDIAEVPAVPARYRPYTETAEADEPLPVQILPEPVQDAPAEDPVPVEEESSREERPEVPGEPEEEDHPVRAVRSARRKGRRFGESDTSGESLSIRKDERIPDCRPAKTFEEARDALCPFRRYKGMGIGQIASTFSGKQYIASIAGDSPLWEEIIAGYPNFRDASRKFCEEMGIEPVSDWGEKN